MKKLILLLSLTLSFSSIAQQIPTLSLNDTAALQLTALKVDLTIIGNIATTTYDMRFYNGYDRTLEGELHFPLGDGQSVSNFAMEVNGNLRDAVIVEKELARVAFENTVRNYIDPGLLEKTEGNNYKARVYPILPKQDKRIVLTCEQPVSAIDASYFVELPLQMEESLADFSLHIEVFGNSNKPVLRGYATATEFKREPDKWVFESKVQHYRPKNTLVITYTTTDNPLSVQTMDDYFYIYGFPSAPARLKSLPKKISLLWDASYSLRYRKLDKELQLLQNYIAYVKNVEVELIIFSDAIHSKKTFNITNGNSKELEESIRNITYDGGTNYDIFKQQRFAGDEVLLFSDGLANLGISDAITIPVYTINSNVSANHELLRNLATRTGGNTINLVRLPLDTALELLKQETFQFLGFAPNDELYEVYPIKNTNVNSDFAVSGKFKSTTTVEFLFGYQNEVTSRIKVPVENLTDTKLVKRLWAKQKLYALNRHKKENKEAIISLAKQHHLITDYTSMLILDQVEDYVRYGIEPPRELRQAYKEMLENRQEEEKYMQGLIAERKEELVEDYQSIDEWYATRFPRRAKKRSKQIAQPANHPTANTPDPEIEIEIEDQTVRPTTGETVSRPEQNVTTAVLDSTQHIVRGVVLDSGGPIPGANVIVKGTTNGTITDFDGNFALNANPEDELQISFIGYTTKEVPVGNSPNQTITLEADEQHLDEVVVIGYGTETRSRAVSYSVTSVVAHSLEGKASGVDISGQVGSASSVDIRGNAALENGPLYIVDGKPVTGNPLTSLDPKDIHAMEVLNTTSAAQIYGAQAANGIMVITTKAGMENEAEAIREFNAKVDAQLELKPWDPEEPYIKLLAKEKDVITAYQKYLEIRDTYSSSPSFYLDVADFFDRRGARTIALTIVTNLMEIDLHNYELMRAFAYKLEYFKEYAMAVGVYEKVLDLRPEDPQSYRDLALGYEQVGAYQKSFDLLYMLYNGQLLEKDEEELYYGIEHMAYVELCRLVYNNKRALKLSRKQRKQFRAMPMNLRVVIDWNHKDTDIDLWVVDPNKEKAFYKNNETAIGGFMSEDLMDGFGPESFMLKKAIPGEYKVLVDYYTDTQQKISGPTLLKVTVYQHYGTPKETKQVHVVRLDQEEEEREVVVFRI